MHGIFQHIHTLGVGWLMSLLLEPKIRLDVEKIVSPAPLKDVVFIVRR